MKFLKRNNLNITLFSNEQFMHTINFVNKIANFDIFNYAIGKISDQKYKKLINIKGKYFLLIVKQEIERIEKMKWQLLTLGFSWGILLFKLYQQYRNCKKIYHNQHILQGQSLQKAQGITFNSQKDLNSNEELIEAGIVEPVIVSPQIEGKQQIQLNPSKNIQSSQETAIDECQFVVFPELYPHLRKRKNLIRKLARDKSSNQKNRILAKRKKDTKMYKQWFITNKMLTEIQQSGQLTPEQFEENYAKITKQIKSTCIDTQKSISETGRSQQGIEIGNGSIVIRKSSEKKMVQDGRVLEFLEEEDGLEINCCKVVKYDPFV